MRNRPEKDSENQVAFSDGKGMVHQTNNILDVAKGGGVALIGTIATRVLSYLYQFVLIGAMGADSFGKFTLAMAVITFVGLVSSIGMPQGILRFGAIEAQEQGKESVHRVTKTAFQVTIPISLGLMAIMLIGSNFLATEIFKKTELTPVIQLLALTIPLMSLESCLLASTRALNVMKYSTIVGIVQPLTALVLAVPLVASGGGAISAAFAFFISYILGAGLAFYFYRRLIPRPEQKASKQLLIKMAKFSIPLSLTEWMHYANERTEIIFLGMLPGATAISIYRIAWSLAGLETILRLSLEQILAPFSSRMVHRKEIIELGRLYKATTKWGFTFALMIFLIYVLFSRDILNFFDPALVVGAGVLIALSFAQLFNEFTGPCNTILIMSGRSDLTLINMIVIFLLTVGFDWLLIPRYGLLGATIVGSISIILLNIARVVEVWWLLRIHPFKLNFYKPVLAGLFAAGIILAAQYLHWTETLLSALVAICIFCALYLAAIVLFKLDADDLVVLDAIKQKVLTLRLKKTVNPADKKGFTPEDFS